MINMSMQAALLIYTICFIFGLIFTSYEYYVVEKQRYEIKFFVLFNLLATIGALLIYNRTELSPFVSIIIANIFLVLAYCHLLIGVRKLLGATKSFKFIATIFTIYTVLHSYFTYVDFQVLLRVHVYNATIIFILGYTYYSIKSMKLKNRELMSTVLVFIIVSILSRSINLLIYHETTNSFISFEYDPIFIVIMGLSNMLILVGLLSLLNYQSVEDLVESERSKTSLLSNLPGFAYRCLNDEFWTMEFLSQGFKDVTGYENEDVLYNSKLSFADLIVENDREYVRESWNQVIRDKNNYMAEYKIRKKDGKEVWILEQGVGIYNEDNECNAIEGFITDVNNRKNMEDSLAFLSYRDYLTGLYNRRFIEDQLRRLETSRSLPISIIMGDINGLKFVNDSLGHEYGDMLIKSVAEILQDSLRGYEFIARLSGDEYLVILESTSKEEVKGVVDRIQENIKKHENVKFGLSVSFGYETKTEDNETIAQVVRDAEDMMYKQKLYSKPSSRRQTVDAVLSTLFEKDAESEIHSRNVSKYSSILAKAAGMSDDDVRKTATAGLLHDVGKIIVDANILKSSRALTDQEYDEIKKHTEIGYRILYNVEELREMANIILCHHERPDGKGYPNGLTDEYIPFISKIISICDAFEAMTHERRYKKPISPQDAFKELRANAGTQFDQDLVEKFIEAMKDNEVS